MWISNGIKCKKLLLYYAKAIACKNSLSIKETGFHVRVDYPFLGASPGSIVPCNCHEPLEIKCPSNYEDGFLNWENDKDFPVAKNHSMKASHQYYFQIQ